MADNAANARHPATPTPPSAPARHEERGAARPRRVLGWLDDRLGLSALRYAVPPHANTIWYTLGGVTFVGLLVLIASGVWLGQYYNPDPLAARQSVIQIQNNVRLGDVIRGIHVWMAYIVVITSALHLIRIVVTASYKEPRELNWLVGLALFGAVLFGSVFTGTVLRWDQEAYEAMVHNMEIAGVLGSFGGFFSDTFSTSVSMLPRLYIAHVSIVPMLILALLVAHIFLIKHHGISPTPTQADAGEAPGGRLPKARETARYQTHLRVMFGYGLALVAFAATLGLLFPQKIGPAPDPTLEVTKPPFIFFWLYAFEDWFQVTGILYAVIVFFGLLALVPFVDRTPLRHLRRRPAVAVVGALLLAAILVLSIRVGTAPVAQHLQQQ